jgi:hypothetical protein
MTVAKVKVKRTELIRVVEGRLRKLEADNKRRKEEYPAKLDAWREKAAQELEKKAANLRRGKTIDDGKYGRITLPDRPVEPDGYRERCQLERTLKTLKIGTEDAILLSPDDADHYFGPCSTKR